MRQIPTMMIMAALAAIISLLAATVARPAEGKHVVIHIQGFEFTPENPTLSVGDVVVWINDDIVSHTVTSNDESWDSGEIETGGTWQTVIIADMVQDYFCRFHPSMIARLEIESNQADARHVTGLTTASAGFRFADQQPSSGN